MARRKRNKIPQETPIVEIQNLSHDGKGIAKINQKVVFVAGALPNEAVQIKYTKSKRSFDEAVATDILRRSKFRVSPKCDYFMLCGGCALQHLSTEQQLILKQQYLLDEFQKKIVVPKNILKPLTSDFWGYRRKARLGVRVVDKKGGALVGFRELNSGFLAVMDSCEILHPKVGYQISALKSLINQMSIGNKIAQIEMAMGDVDCILIFRNLVDLPTLDIDLLDKFGQSRGLYIYLQSGGIDTIKPLNKQHEIQLNYQITVSNKTLSFDFNPYNFTQVNFEINQKMITLAMQLLDIQPDENALDLFCGLGNFTLAMAQKASFVLGLEGSTSLVQDAFHNAKINQIDNVDFAVLDLQTDNFQGTWLQKKWHKILLDPPRSGAEEMMPVLAKFQAKTIVYVSCNPVTLARDADILVNQFGYTCDEIGVMDMFVHTAHVESIALFQKP